MKYLHFFIVTICAVCFAQDKAPTLLWDIPLNEGDFSQMRNLGKLHDAVPVASSQNKLEWGPGRLEGKALYFRNDAGGKRPVTALQIPAAQSYDFSKPFTLSCWIMIDPACKDTNQYTILGNTPSDYGPGFRIIYGWGTMRTAFGDGTAEHADGLRMPATQVACPLGCWHHVALTYDGELAVLFFNGIAVNEKKTTIIPTKPVLRPFSIGSYNSSAYGFPGAISAIKLYDKALTPLEVLKLAKEL